jgi:hypothetical protein
MKVSEIMRPRQKGHPITYNPYFTDIIQEARQEHLKKNMIRSLNAFFKLKPGASKRPKPMVGSPGPTRRRIMWYRRRRSLPTDTK